MTPHDAPFRVAVIGYGFAGRCFHSYLAGLTPGLVLHGIASRNPETRKKIEAEKKCRAYDSVESAVADPAVDLVVVASPTSAHASQAIAALNAGRHVVVDKPACLNGAEFDAMAAAQGNSGKILTFFHNRRWDGDYLTLKKCLAEGRLGELRRTEMAWGSFGMWGGWRGKKEMGGGKLYDLGAHLVDQTLLLNPGPVESVYCRMGHDFPEYSIESQAVVVIAFASGATGIIDVSSLAAIPKPRFAAYGTKGNFVKYGLDPQEKAMIAGDIGAAREEEAMQAEYSDGKSRTRVPTLAGRWRSFYENVADALAGRAEPAVKVSEVRRTVAVIDAAFESARSGQAIIRKI
jgi:scyllo-inositol 2-dehydrogenase (NADP+)